MSDELQFQKTFSRWKIWVAISLGLSIATWMMYRSLNHVNFIEVKSGNGNYSWIDVNHNQIIDSSNPKEFQSNPKGNFKKESLSDTIQLINWTKASFVWLLLALVFMVGRDFFYMLRIRILTKNQLTWKQCFNVIMLWEFASALSPGVVGGTTVAMFILQKEKIDLGRSTAIVMITALMDNLFYLVLVPLVFIFINQDQLFPANFSASKSVSFIFWTGFGIKLLLCVFILFSVFLFPKVAAQILKTVFSLPILNKWHAIASKTGEEIQMASKEFKKENFLFWLKTMVSTFLSWSSRYLVINCILNAFLHLHFLDNFLLLGKQIVLWLLMMISPTPGGSGVAEYAFGELMNPFSDSLLLIAALALLWRLISYFPYLFIGVFVLPRWIKK
ncbi:MAG: flippase-like domain-containing protein [Flavobacteriia bacterium]|nr:flippase-like domain-containing protein [Flavobacteriia bacterium]